jgi:tyrosine-protein phosphatase YwqE
VFSFFKKNSKQTVLPYIDVHSHLLPGIDDGVQSLEESVSIIKQFSELGYKKLITTPHIMNDFYPNTPEIINEKLSLVRQAIVKEKLSIQIEAAAEYYFDEHFISLIKSKSKLLTFGDNYLLFEIGFISEPLQLRTAIFDLITLGYKPVLAHPERYLYYHQKLDGLQDLIDRGVLLQLNLNSVVGYYSKEVKKTTEKLIDNNMIHLIGSDCHNQRHFDVMKEVFDHKIYRKLSSLTLLNNTL